MLSWRNRKNVIWIPPLTPYNHPTVHSYRSNQGPVVQSINSLTSSLVVKMLIVLVSTIPNSQVFLRKNVSSFCKCKSYSHFFGKNISVYAIFNDQSFNDTLTMILLVLNNWVQFCKRRVKPMSRLYRCTR